MQWPTATVILGVLGTVCVAILRMLPWRAAQGAHDFQADIAVLKATVDILGRELQQLRVEMSRLREAIAQHRGML